MKRNNKSSCTSLKSMAVKQSKERKNTRNRYLKPGALARLRDSRVSTKSFTDIDKKKSVVLKSNDERANILLNDEIVVHNDKHIASPINLMAPPTPKTPENSGQLSRLESLHPDILVKILCYLHHDQLRPVFHVSQHLRKSVIMARQVHFNYTTPDRSRQEMLRTQTPLPTEHWPFARFVKPKTLYQHLFHHRLSSCDIYSKGDGRGICIPSPTTPGAPKHGARPSRLYKIDMQPIAAVLFKDEDEDKLPSKAVNPNRVLFSEDELCQAVAQNNLQ